MVEALVGHLVGDYLAQNDWMAANKKKASFPCLVHCILWAASVCAFAGWGWPSFIVLFVFHFIQDRTNIVAWWMNFIGQGGFATGICSPWSVIVVDNVWHVVQIWAVWKLMEGGV